MHLAPEDVDKLLLHNAGFLAQKRLARGLRLNYPEAVALLATQALEFIRDGRTLAEVEEMARAILGTGDVMEGVAAMISELRVEGTFSDGAHTVVVAHPIAEDQGNLMLALYGSFLPVPSREAFEKAEFGAAPTALDGPVGEVLSGAGELELNAGRETIVLQVVNRGARPVCVGSHFHFMEANRALVFDRGQAYGRRLNIPAGTTVSFEPGEPRSVTLVTLGGNRVLHGGSGACSGPVGEAEQALALERWNNLNANDPGEQGATPG
jgi:urease subunit gamma/beta